MSQLDAPRFAPLDKTVEVTEMKTGNISQPEDKAQVKSKSRDLPYLMDGDMLQVTNDDTKTLDFQWAKKHYIVEPGQTGWVIFEALVEALGDPRSMDNMISKYNDGNGNEGLVLPRHMELSRLFARYAVFNEQLEDVMDKGTLVPGLTSKAPKVRVSTMNGQRVTFPSQRPDMLPFPVALIDDAKINTDMTRVVDQLHAENAEYKERLDRLEAALQEEIARREPANG
jgi:hypothetical protein